jgi:SAM-dependent methyltransferase
MSHYGWIDGNEFSFNTLMLFDYRLVGCLAQEGGDEFKERFAVALAAHPDVCWYLCERRPDCREAFERLVGSAPAGSSPEYIRECEVFVIEALETDIVYVYPEIMDELDYIREWDPSRLLSITDFTGKAVLDIGSGTGRLAVAAASRASYVYACDPTDRLREYLKRKLERLGIENVFVVDGMIERLPFPDEMFDIVVSGHVIGDDYDRELKEIDRVLKPGGFNIDCPGEEKEKRPDGLDQAMLDRGFEHRHYVSVLGGDVYDYWKQKKR